MNVKSRECKFITFLPKIEGKREDTHVIKEIVEYEDGTKEAKLRILENFQRPFYITKPHLQRHKQKKEAEYLSNLNEYKSTQSELAKNIGKRLGGPRYARNPTMRDISMSPYVYGTDVEARILIKKMYTDKYPEAVSNNKVATFDIEVDTETDKVIIVSLATREKVFVSILADIIKNPRDLEEQLKYLYDKYIPKTEITETAQIEFKMYHTEMEIISAAIMKAHEWKPDLVAIWNIDYDIPKILDVCEKNGVDPADLFTDPDLPKNLRHFEYKQGAKSKMTDSGKYKPINVEEQWHYIICPAHFYWIDAMCAYKYIRLAAKSVPGGYSLDNILEHELGSELKKLKFNEDYKGTLAGINFHKYMVANKPLEYIIYNVWDTMSMLQLDEKTQDLQFTIFLLAGVSPLDIFNSSPKKIVNEIYFYYLEHEMVMGVRPPQYDGDNGLELDDWIVLLPNHRISDNGLKIIEEDPELSTNIRAMVYDADQSAGYPSDTIAANVSGSTTMQELLDIEGIDKQEFKLQNINLFFGKVNALEYFQTMFNFPVLSELGKAYEEKMKT